MTLRERAIRLAYERPELREKILPLLKQSNETIWYKSLDIVEVVVTWDGRNYQEGRDENTIDSWYNNSDWNAKGLFTKLLRTFGPGLKDRSNWYSQSSGKVVCEWYGGDDYNPLSRNETEQWKAGDVNQYKYILTIDFGDDAVARRFLKKNRL